MAIQDPYPDDLAALEAAGLIAPDREEGDHHLLEMAQPIAPNPDAVTNRLIVAVNRLAQAVEQNTLALLHPLPHPLNASQPFAQPVQNAPQAAPGALAPLPPVQVVAAKPPCIWHGVDKVRPSSKGGFYCTAQPGIGQPNTNPKGYCVWHT